MSQIGEQLLTLVDALSRNSTQHDDNQHNSTSSKLLYDQLRARRLRLSSRILASHLTPGVELSDKAHITKLIKTKLLRERGSNAVDRFDQIVSQLEHDSSQTSKVWAMLYLLFTVSDGRNVHRVVDSSYGDERAVRTSATNRTMLGVESVTLAQSRLCVSEAAPRMFIPPESDVVRDLLFQFQGIDGTLIRFDAPTRRFLIDERAQLSNPARALTLKLCELSRAYRRIDAFLKRRAADGPRVGLVMQALCAAIRQELTKFYELLASLELQQRALTLRSLASQLSVSASRLNWLATVSGAAASTRGGALLCVVAQHGAHGDDSLSTLTTELFQRAFVPLRDMVRRWVLRGELHDSHSEFFIIDCQSLDDDDDNNDNIGRRSDTNVTSSTTHPSTTGAQQSLWHERFSLLDAQLPPETVLSASSAATALLVGKSLCFLSAACNDMDAVDAVASGIRRAGVADHDLTATIATAARVVNRRLLDTIFDVYHLKQHFSSLRRYLLLEQGDFATSLVTLLADELDRPASSLARHRLVSALDTAVRNSVGGEMYGGRTNEASLGKQDYTDATQRVDVRLLPLDSLPNGGAKARGWDVMVLDYRVTPPLDAVLTPTAMLRYGRIFRFLWRLRRVDYQLGVAWAAHMALPSSLLRGNDIHRAQLLRGDMAQFVTSLQHYASATAIDGAWRTLQAALDKADHLDGVIDAHNQYLASMMTNLLLTKPTLPIRRHIDVMLRACLQFCSIYVALCRNIDAAAKSDSAHEYRLSDAESSRITTLADNFTDQMIALAALLNDDAAISGVRVHHTTRDNLQFLATRLDFSECYTRRAEDKMLREILSK